MISPTSSFESDLVSLFSVTITSKPDTSIREGLRHAAIIALQLDTTVFFHHGETVIIVSAASILHEADHQEKS